MNLTRDRIHTMGWGTALALCLAVTAGVSARVSAEKSKAALAARQVAGLHQEIGYLRTEFEARSSQQMLQQINLDFGYEAPTAAQYLAGERQLAALSQPAEPGAPPPVRFAGNTGADGAGDGAGAGAAAQAGAPMPVTVAVAGAPAAGGAGAGAMVLRAGLRARLSRLGDAAGISRE